MKIAISLVLLFLCAGCLYAQRYTATLPGVEEMYLALDDGHGKAGEQVSEFRTTDIPIHCVVLLDRADATTVKMNFVAVSVAGVKPDTKVVTANYTTKDGQNRVNFTGRPDDRWTPGKYRVEIIIGDKMVKSIEFEIKAASSPAPAQEKFLQPRQTVKPKISKRP